MARSPEDYFLIVSALVPYKRIDMAIEAASQAGVPLKIVGDGPEQARLERAAGDADASSGSGRASNEEIRDAVPRCARPFSCPAKRTSASSPLEAQACGRPVVALGRGGALETVRARGDRRARRRARRRGTRRRRSAALRRSTFDPAAIRAHAERFSRERFAIEIRACIDETAAAPGDARW